MSKNTSNSMELDELFGIVEKALEGDSDAQRRLGDCFYNGIGVNVDYQKAAFWYEKVAEKDERVKYHLGVCCYSEHDYEKARLWFEQSAEQECSEAQFELGRCYEKGKGVIANREKSLYWYTKSAEHGNLRARISLAYLYLEDQNLEKAEFWFAMAKQWGGWNDRFEMLKSIYERMESITINKDNIDWFKSCGERGVKEAQYKLGEYCKQEASNPLNKNRIFGKPIYWYNTAFKWYKKAADQGHKDAQYEVGICYVKGIGVDMNLEEGNVWLRKAADQGQIEAQRELELLETEKREKEDCRSKTIDTGSKIIASADEVSVPTDIIQYVEKNREKYWTGVSAKWTFRRSGNEKDFARLKEAEPIIKEEFRKQGWNVEMAILGDRIKFGITKLGNKLEFGDLLW